MNSKSRQIDLAKGLKLINNRIINNVIVGIKVGISCLEGNLAHTQKNQEPWIYKEFPKISILGMNVYVTFNFWFSISTENLKENDQPSHNKLPLVALLWSWHIIHTESGFGRTIWIQSIWISTKQISKD